MNENILNIIESVLGKGYEQGKKGDVLFYCPTCNHYKRKLSVNIDMSSQKFGNWACWVCGDTHGTKGRSLFTLLKKYNATEQQLRELSDIIQDSTYIPTEYKTNKKEIIRLPDEFIPLWIERDTIGRRHAMAELRRRNINKLDIIKYQIGYCEDGIYANRIIVPSYDENGLLNYFVARSYFPDEKMKYKNPPISKDIIAFDMFINWNLSVIICEGVMDAIAIKRNAIPLLGKSLLDNLFKKIIMMKPPSVYIALDNDAIGNAIKISEKLIQEGIKVYLVKLNKKDPSDIGYIEMVNVIQNNSVELNDNTIFRYKLMNKVL